MTEKRKINDEEEEKEEGVLELEIGEIEDDVDDQQPQPTASLVAATTTTPSSTSETPSTTTAIDGGEPQEINEELSDILTSLADTFITESNFSSFEDLFMFIEEAYWYYIDIHLIQNPRLPKLDFPKFAEQILKNNERLLPLHEALLTTTTYEEMIKRFESFKRLIPRYGAIILNKDMTKVVLVKEQWWGWGFPKGKGKEGETETSSATREVFEEIGYDISPFIKKEDYIQKETHGVVKKFFVIVGVDEQVDFETHTRYEISRIKWHKIEDIPLIHSRASHQFAAIIPYIKSLINWIQTKRKEKNLPPINFDKDKDQHHGGDVDLGSIKRWSQQNKKSKNDVGNNNRAKPHQEEDERDVILLNEIEDVKLGEFIQSLKDHLKEIPLKESINGSNGLSGSGTTTPKLNSNLRNMGTTFNTSGGNQNQHQQHQPQQFKVLTNNQLNKSLSDMTTNNFYNNQQQQLNNKPKASAMNELDLINLLSNSISTNTSQNNSSNNNNNNDSNSPTLSNQHRQQQQQPQQNQQQQQQQQQYHQQQQQIHHNQQPLQNTSNNNSNNYMNNFANMNDYMMAMNNKGNNMGMNSNNMGANNMGMSNMANYNYMNNTNNMGMNNMNNMGMNYYNNNNQQQNQFNNNYPQQQQQQQHHQQQFYNNQMNVNMNQMMMNNMGMNYNNQQQQQQPQSHMMMGNSNQLYYQK